MITKNLNELVINSSAGYGKDKNTEEYDIPVAKVSNVNAYGHFHKSFEIRSFTEKEKNKLIARDNDLFVVKSSGSKSNILSGKTALYKTNEHPELIASNFLLRLTPKEDEVNSKYLWYYLNSQVSKNYIKTIVGTTTYPNLKWNLYGKMPIPLPPLDQQKKIAAILDAADAYRQKTKTLIEKYDELAQSLFLDMFGDPVTNSKGWRKHKLGDICHMKAGKGVKASDIISENNSNMYSCFGGNGLRGYVESFTHEGEFLLIGRQGALCGNVKKVKGKFHATEHAIVCSPTMEYETLWLYHMLVMINLNKYSTGAAQPGLNVGTLVELEVMFAPYALQNQFAERVQAIEAQKAQAQASLSQAEDLFNSLLQRAFKGELV